MNKKFQTIRYQMTPKGRKFGISRLGKPTNLKYVMSLTKEELDTEFDLIRDKKSKLSNNLRQMITVRKILMDRKDV